MSENNGNTIERVTPDDAGCWIEGSRGWYGSQRLIEIAESYGFALSAEDRDAVDAYFASDDADGSAAEAVTGQGGIADDAEDYLNANVAPEGYSFGWHDGEFFLWSEDYWQETA